MSAKSTTKPSIKLFAARSNKKRTRHKIFTHDIPFGFFTWKEAEKYVRAYAAKYPNSKVAKSVNQNRISFVMNITINPAPSKPTKPKKPATGGLTINPKPKK